MSEERFPPTPDHKHEWEALLNILSSVIGEPNSAVYVSSPMTSGARFAEWFSVEGNKLDPGGNEYRRRHFEKVIRPNINRARAFVARVRRKGHLVIEPTSLDIRYWTQNDYRHLWGVVIERYAKEVFFMDGWEFSSGCSYEFLIAAKSKKVLRAESGKRLTPEMGALCIESALAQLDKLGIHSAFLDRVAAELRTTLSRPIPVASRALLKI